jgi:hypothetical protein
MQRKTHGVLASIACWALYVLFTHMALPLHPDMPESMAVRSLRKLPPRVQRAHPHALPAAGRAARTHVQPAVHAHDRPAGQVRSASTLRSAILQHLR